jgi:hypothetical protein
MQRQCLGKSVALLSALVLAAALLAPIALAAARGDTPAPGPNGPQQGPTRPDARKLEPGQPAPDFALPRLIVAKDASGNAVGKVSEERVKLSSLAGGKPVCLIFTSYT